MTKRPVPEELEGQLELFEDPHVLSVDARTRNQPVYEVAAWPVEREDDAEESREFC